MVDDRPVTALTGVLLSCKTSGDPQVVTTPVCGVEHANWHRPLLAYREAMREHQEQHDPECSGGMDYHWIFPRVATEAPTGYLDNFAPGSNATVRRIIYNFAKELSDEWMRADPPAVQLDGARPPAELPASHAHDPAQREKFLHHVPCPARGSPRGGRETAGHAGTLDGW